MLSALALRRFELPHRGPTALARASNRGFVRPANRGQLRVSRRSAWPGGAIRAQRTPLEHATPPVPPQLTGKAAERAQEETAARQRFEAQAAEGSGDQGLQRVLLNSALALLEEAAATRKVSDAALPQHFLLNPFVPAASSAPHSLR